MQLEQLAGAGMETEYNLMIRDYAADASEENSERVRALFSDMSAQDLTHPRSSSPVPAWRPSTTS